MKQPLRLLGIAAFTALTALPAAAQTAKPSVTIGLPGIPPVFVAVQSYVALQEKLFDKYGVNVTLRPFELRRSSSARARLRRCRHVAVTVAANR